LQHLVRPDDVERRHIGKHDRCDLHDLTFQLGPAYGERLLSFREHTITR
jgi:hypothetical protein